MIPIWWHMTVPRSATLVMLAQERLLSQIPRLMRRVATFAQLAITVLKAPLLKSHVPWDLIEKRREPLKNGRLTLTVSRSVTATVVTDVPVVSNVTNVASLTKLEMLSSVRQDSGALTHQSPIHVTQDISA